MTVRVLSWLPGSQLHSPASHHPPDGSLSSRLCDPLSWIRTIGPLLLCLQISWICPLLQDTGTVPCWLLSSSWRASQSMQTHSCNINIWAPHAIINLQATSCALLSGTHSYNYTLKLGHCLGLLCFQYELFRYSSFWPQPPIFLGYF